MDEEEGLAAHYYAAEDDVEGLLEDGTDDAADFPHTGAGEDGDGDGDDGDDGGDGDGDDGDGDVPRGAALLPGDVREATGRRTLRGGRRPAPAAAAAPGARRRRRRLQDLATHSVGDFAPLTCNAALDAADCGGPARRLSALVAAAGAPVVPDAAALTDPAADAATAAAVVVPCGECYTYDLAGTATLGGLDVQGRLVVPRNHKSTLRTPYVFVQGVLEASDDNPVSRDHEGLRIVLTGTDDVEFVPAGSNAGVPGTPFHAGSKPFLVAGGRLDLRGWDGGGDEEDAVAPWSPPLATAEGALPVPPLAAVPGAEEAPLDPPYRRVVPADAAPPPLCPRRLVDHDFAAHGVDHRVWSGGDGNLVRWENGTMSVSDLREDWQGLRLDFT